MMLGLRARKVLLFWRLVCETFRKIVDSKYFGRGIMIAILINTLSMGIEYHEQVGASRSQRRFANITQGLVVLVRKICIQEDRSLVWLSCLFLLNSKLLDVKAMREYF